MKPSLQRGGVVSGLWGRPRRTNRSPLVGLPSLLAAVVLILGGRAESQFEPLIRLPSGGDAAGVGDSVWPRRGVVSVDRFGAIGDGLHDDTEAFLLAWRSACSISSQSQTVLKIPSGRTYLVGPIDFHGPCCTNLTMSVMGTIIAPEDPGVWKSLNPHKWLFFDGVNHLNIRGRGTINGMGERWWARSCKVNKKNAVTFHRCENLRIRNLKLVNSQQMHVSFIQSINVKASGLKVIAPADSPNTDGIHISGSTNVEIKECEIMTGDDCISIVSNSSKVKIKNIKCGPGHGISIGSLGKLNSLSSVSDVLVDRVNFSNTENGFRIKTWQGGKGLAHNITFQNAVMVNVSHPIIVDQYYCDSRFPCPNQTSAVKVDEVRFKRIRGTSTTHNAISIACSDSTPCENVHLRDIQLSLEAGGGASSYCWNAYGSSSGLVDPPSCLQSNGESPDGSKLLSNGVLRLISRWVGNILSPP